MKQIPVNNPKGPTVYALVDDTDFDLVSSYKWQFTRDRYAKTSITLSDGSRQYPFMHHILMGKKEGFVIDHADRDKLNNQRANLRFCTACQNEYNKPGHTFGGKYKGINWNTVSNQWDVKIRENRRRHYLGCYPTEEEAARVYDAFARKYHGEFAYLNFPDDPPTVDTTLDPVQFVRSKRGFISLYYGVTRRVRKRRHHTTTTYEAYVCHNYERKFVGAYKTEIEAAKAYDARVKELGLKKPVNFQD